MKQATNTGRKAIVTAGKVVRILHSFSVTLGEIREITLHPSGSKFDGPAVVVAAFGQTVFGLRDSRGRVAPKFGAFVDLVSLADPSRRVVRRLVAVSTEELS